jgi:hypothetical protein
VDCGFGGSIKSLFRAALQSDADYIIELHPDNQYDPAGIPSLLDEMGHHRYAMVIASRFLPARRALEGGMPWWKFIANRILTGLNNVMMGVWLSEYHSGFRIYSARWAKGLPLDSFSDDFILGFQLISGGHRRLAIGPGAGFCRYFPKRPRTARLRRVRLGHADRVVPRLQAPSGDRHTRGESLVTRRPLHLGTRA